MGPFNFLLKGLFRFCMNKKLSIFLLIILFVFSYTVYESLKLEKKLSKTNFSQTGTIILKFPENVIWNNIKSGEKFDYNEILIGGSKVVVHFWATWCAPCEAEFPELVELAKIISNNDKIKFILVAVNDDKLKVSKFLSKFHLSNNIYVVSDDADEYKRFGTYKLPETFLFNYDGEVIKKYSGQQAWSEGKMVRFFQDL